MTDHVPPAGLHPNIARIAAAYDVILEQLGNRQLSVTEARAKVAQLEARDDQGTRWSIDPDTGQFVRKTAMGAEEYDTPPRVGYQTDDAFSYTRPQGTNPFAHAGQVEDPNQRVEMFTAPGDRLTMPPTQLAGATRHGPTSQSSNHAGGSPLAALKRLPVAARAGLAATVVIILLLLVAGLTGDDEPAQAPGEQPRDSVTKTEKPAKGDAEKAPAKKP